jgi:hypothetical protein
MGNEGNIARLLTGGTRPELQSAAAGAAHRHRDDGRGFNAVQAIWDLMAELTPEAQAARAVRPRNELVAHTPLVTRHALRGGTTPSCDPRGSTAIGEKEDAVVADALRAAHTAATSAAATRAAG